MSTDNKTSWVIKLKGQTVVGTESSSEAGSWNKLCNIPGYCILRPLSAKELARRGFISSKEKHK